MNDDIVTRLRAWAEVPSNDYLANDMSEAADEIERLGELLFQEIYYGQEKLDEIERLRYELVQANNKIKLLIAIETAGQQAVRGE